ncbi:uncharacterized protein ACOB7L_010546 isoform 1-T1 [Callospermophilus lateralis]|uniref:uncharacterized protein LOC143392201 n=1 Tax=Callospermophilus lateralis TaxID=76772 RepID=UPI0040387459
MSWAAPPTPVRVPRARLRRCGGPGLIGCRTSWGGLSLTCPFVPSLYESLFLLHLPTSAHPSRPLWKIPASARSPAALCHHLPGPQAPLVPLLPQEEVLRGPRQDNVRDTLSSWTATRASSAAPPTCHQGPEQWIRPAMD